jgi:hypothetical protein
MLLSLMYCFGNTHKLNLSDPYTTAILVGAMMIILCISSVHLVSSCLPSSLYRIHRHVGLSLQ